MTDPAAPRVEVRPDPPTLARDVAHELCAIIRDAQRERGSASIVLTGGGIGTAVLAALPDVDDPPDWSAVDAWWGDERFLPEGDPDRNATQARAVFLDRVPLDPARVHPMPADRGQGLAAAAADYAAELSVPRVFDVLMLGVGPEGHVASLFPHSPGLTASASVVAVPDSPKPPPERVSMSLGTIRSARRVWWIAAGSEKAAAIAGALRPGAEAADLPVAGARGTQETVAWLDPAAAALIADGSRDRLSDGGAC